LAPAAVSAIAPIGGLRRGGGCVAPNVSTEVDRNNSRSGVGSNLSHSLEGSVVPLCIVQLNPTTATFGTVGQRWRNE
jgi:hypothetical protein